MRLSWNEIRTRAAAFAKEWSGAHYEKGETHSFYNDFFNVFGMVRKRVASFEEPVRLLGTKRGFIDLFWRGVLLVEQKSAGRSLIPAKQQALDYFPGLKDEDLPRFILLSDFQSFELFDLEENTCKKFTLGELPRYVEEFGFILGVTKRAFRDQDPVNIKASELMGKLHDALLNSGYSGTDLERLLVRLLFCLFADDTGIFDSRGIFETLVRDRTREDGSDVGQWLIHLFEVLNTPIAKRQTKLDEDLQQFPFVNGDLFGGRLSIPSFDSSMRQRLLEACDFLWDAISPAIFGSLFQSVMNAQERRAGGAHYTTEKNILKVIGALFMEELWNEFDALKARRDSRSRQELNDFHARLRGLRFFDPACGCGNFLVIAYRELRSLENELIVEIGKRRYDEKTLELELEVSALALINVDQFYGIEIEEFPVRIAETAMWMMDHIMNNRLSLQLGRIYKRIPLTKSARIVQGNALQLDWNSVLPASDCNYVFGNPPFRGHQWRSVEQQRDMRAVWGSAGQFNRLDYAACWFRKAVDFSDPNRKIQIAFVSTNSIAQGEQCGILWPFIFGRGAQITFAHRTFRWTSEARGRAAVHCVIVGLAFENGGPRQIFDYDNLAGDPHVSVVKTINGYLVDGPQYSVPARRSPPAGRLKMHKGSQPTDGARRRLPNGSYDMISNLILDADDRRDLLAKDAVAAKWLRPFVGGDELISGNWRWCLWLKDAQPNEVHKSKAVTERLKRVREGRLLSPTPSVRAFAHSPMLFTQDRQPDVEYLAVPEVSSEEREYIPMAMLPPDVIASNKLQIIVGATLEYFGVLTSAMHMAWMRTVTGRLKSDYSYAPAVYNSFPWPVMNEAQRAKLVACTQAVLDARNQFPDSTLESLYNVNTMPRALRHAHTQLDTTVDRLYRRTAFTFERERVEHLFQLHEAAAMPIAKSVARAARKRTGAAN